MRVPDDRQDKRMARVLLLVRVKTSQTRTTTNEVIDRINYALSKDIDIRRDCWNAFDCEWKYSEKIS